MKLKDIFAKNGYPEYVVEQVIRETLHSDKQNGAAPVECSEAKTEVDHVFLRLPWLGNVSNGYRNHGLEM